MMLITLALICGMAINDASSGTARLSAAPPAATLEDMASLEDMAAWERRVRAIPVYVDGRLAGYLIVEYYEWVEVATLEQ